MTARRWWIALAGGMLVAAAAPGGDDFSEIRRLWTAARQTAATDPAAALPQFDALLAQAPGNNGVLRSAIATAYAAEDHERVARWLAVFARQGGGLSAAAFAAIKQQSGSVLPAETLAAIERNSAALGGGTVALSVPASAHLIEGVAQDRRGGATFVSSVVDREILRIDAHGVRSRLFALGQAGAPMGLAADDARGVLWAAVDADPFDKQPGTGGLLRIAFDGGRHRLVTASGGAVHLGDLTVGPDGTAYGADSKDGAVYRCRPGCERLELLVAPGRLRSAQGMAVAPGGRSLWVSDYSYGLLSVDLGSGRIRRVTAAPGIALDGIDGMARRGGRLIAVQNALVPARVIELSPDAAGTGIVAARVLARGGAIAEPTQVALARGGAILVIANSQWSRYDQGPSGAPAQSETRIVRIAP